MNLNLEMLVSEERGKLNNALRKTLRAKRQEQEQQLKPN